MKKKKIDKIEKFPLTNTFKNVLKFVKNKLYKFLKNQKISKNLVIDLICGLVLVTGLVVMYGWYIESSVLVQVLPYFAPMQFNTALCFSLSALGILSVNKSKFLLSNFCAALVITISFITIIQYIFSLNFGLDTLFVKPHIVTRTTHVGRMSPGTAFSFFLIGLGIVLFTKKIVVMGLASAVLTLSILSFITYITKYDDIYGFGTLLRMAIHTTTSFFLLSTAILIAKTKKGESGEYFDLWNTSPIVTGIVLLSITLFSWHSSREYLAEKDYKTFISLTEDVKTAIKNRFLLYEQSLLGGVGFFNASNEVTRKEWLSYSEELNMNTTLIGINGVGFIDYVKVNQPDDLTEYLMKMRKDGLKNFVNHPKTKFDTKFVIRYIEPENINKAAIGLDIGFEANRREAAERAIVTGKSSLTKKIELVQDNKKSPGFLLLIPVYKHNTINETPKQREKNIVGWVYAPFIGNNFLKDINNTVDNKISLNVYDGNEVKPENYIYKEFNLKDDKRFEFKETIQLAQTEWTLLWRTNSLFEGSINSNVPNAILIVGLLFTLLFSALFHLLARLYGYAAKSLAESEERFSLAVEGASDGIWDWEDMSKNKQYWSPQFKKLLGYNVKEIKATHKNFENLIHQEDIKKFEDIVHNSKNIGESFGFEARLKQKSGEYKWFLIRGTLTKNSKNEANRMTGSITDISDRKNAEEKVNEKNKELESFIYIVSHDLRSPLINLKGFTAKAEEYVKNLELFLKKYTKKLSKTDNKEIDEILGNKLPKAEKFISESVDRMDSMTQSILSLSRTGRKEMVFTKINMKELAETYKHTVSHQLHTKKATMIIGNLPTIIGDKQSIEQILGNLLDNAIKYLSPERKGIIKISCKEDEEYYEFCVEDNGRGIAEEDKDKVLMPFRRASNALDVSGDGMGMPHVMALVEKHLGKFRFTSTLNKGSKFYFTISKKLKITDEVNNETAK
ncbi:MAG TPA: CHASE domain-containing protein [Rickettsiales bacterium]|nr:CHASE domain-containing protein [Rickettsiales bacterium]